MSEASQDEIDSWYETSDLRLELGPDLDIEDEPRKAFNARIRRLAFTWKDMFAKSLNDLRPTALIEHPIDVDTDVKPFIHGSFRYPRAQVVFPSMEQAGIIMRANAKWCANTLFRWGK